MIRRVLRNISHEEEVEDEPVQNAVVIEVNKFAVEELVNEDLSGKEVTAVGDESGIMDLTQPVILDKKSDLLLPIHPQEDKISSNHGVIIVERSINLERVILKDRDKTAEAEAVNLTFLSAPKKNSVPKNSAKNKNG
eukprot:augustus_masked-scaffold_21-processed-gene-5.2-mRNA-1 protein AED:1.00 eAED:1.00 QI:0/0/0/0/1/1/2/0/136